MIQNRYKYHELKYGGVERNASDIDNVCTFDI